MVTRGARCWATAQDAERQFQVENLKRRGLLEMDSGHYSDAVET